jgi:hypothetical protein
MGNGVFSCCDVTSSKLNEIAINTGSKTYPQSFSMHEQDLDIRIKLLETLVSGRTLIVKVLNTGALPKGKTYVIRPQGYEESVRIPKDGCTYFGCKSDIEVCDIDISPNETVLEDIQKGKNFIIYYKIDKDSYWIKDLGRGYGAFIKLDNQLV